MKAMLLRLLECPELMVNLPIDPLMDNWTLSDCYCRNLHLSPHSLPRLRPMLNVSFKRNWLCVPTLSHFELDSIGQTSHTHHLILLILSATFETSTSWCPIAITRQCLYRKQWSSLTPRTCLAMRPATSTVNSRIFIKISAYQDTITVACLPNISRKHITVLSRILVTV